jgi:hypothetical protein
MESEGMDKFVQAMAAATPSEAPAATAQPTREEPTREVEQPDAGGGEAEPAQETAPDPYVALKDLGTPEQIREEFEAARNAKAMRRESHLRNETTRREQAQRENELGEMRREISETYRNNRALIEAARVAAQEGNRELSHQFMQMLGSQDGPPPARAGNGQAPTAPGGQSVEDLRREFDSFKKQQAEYTFGDSHSRVLRAAIEEVEQHPTFKRESLQKLGVPDEEVQRIVSKVYEMSNDDPNSVNVFDHRSVRAAVRKFTKERASFYEQLRDADVNDYRSVRKAQNETRDDIVEFYAQQLAQATPRRPAMET